MRINLRQYMSSCPTQEDGVLRYLECCRRRIIRLHAKHCWKPARSRKGGRARAKPAML